MTHEAHPDPAHTAAPSAPAGSNVLEGTPYRAIKRIGAGGMGTVLEAEHRALGKRVVVKLLHPELAREPRLVERLKREARVLARAASPYLVAVTDLGQTASGATYLAMERLYGNTLGYELRTRGAVPVADAIRWVRQMLFGLGAAHRVGTVHRDVKLDNVFLCDATEHEPRRIKLLDFGIAKVLDEGMHSGHQPTAEGTLLGSPRWLAPEQALGLPVDARADIYSAGLVLYSLLVGHGPFAHHRDPMAAIEAAITERPEPPSKLAAQHVPAALDEIVMMAIEKDPDLRFRSAEAFAHALESVEASLVGPATASNDVIPTADDHCESTAPTLLQGARANDAREANGARRPPSLAAFLGLTAASAVLVTTAVLAVARVLGRW